MWQQRLAALQAEPTDHHLQLVCDLLDEEDAEVCRRWNEAGHVERLGGASGKAGRRAAAHDGPAVDTWRRVGERRTHVSD